MPFRRQASVLGWLIFAAGAAVLLGDTIWGGRVLADGDVLDYYYPIKTLIRHLFLHGHSLVWNPFLGEGQPLASNPQHEMFYPFTWLVFAVPVPVALALSNAAHLALMFGGMLRLLRRLRRSESAAIFGAIAWTFGGVAVSSLHLFEHFIIWTWIPWLCAVAARKQSISATVVQGGFFGGIILLIGEPVSALLAAFAFLATLLAQGPVSRRDLAAMAAAGALAIGIGAAMWAPGFALASKSIRRSGLPAEEAAQRSFPLARAAELVVPNAFGDVRPHTFLNYQGWRLYPGANWPYFWGIYSGALVLPLVLGGLLGRKRPELIFGGAAALAFVASLGPPGRLWTLLRQVIPGFNGVRYPEKMLALPVFFCIIVATRGLDRSRTRRRTRRAIVGAALAVGAVLGLLTLMPTVSISIAQSFWQNVSPAAATAAVRAILASASVRHLLLGALLAVAISLPRGKRRRGAVTVLLAATAADVVSASKALFGTRDARWMDAPPPVVRQLRQVSPVPRLADFLPIEPPGRPGFVPDQNGQFDRNRLTFEQPVQWGIPLALDQDYDLTFTRSERRARYLVNRILLVDHRVFGALLAARHIGALLLWKSPITLEDPVTVAAVAGVRPEVDSAETLATFRGDEDFIRTALGTKKDLRRTIFVEGAAPIPESEFSPARLDRIETGDTAVSFDSVASGSSLTRVARTNDGNWRASVDGKPSPVLTVDISMIGIAVPPGRHHVELRYRDPWLEIGAAVSAFSLVILAAVAAAGARRRGSPAPSA